jgi:hypothetical protein
MPHDFDSGLEKPQRTLIRAAIADRLGALLTSANPPRYVTAIRFLPRIVRGEGDSEGLAMLIEVSRGKAPAIFIALGRRRPLDEMTDPLELRAELEVAIYLVSAHARDLVDGRLAGDGISTVNLTADPGIEVMLEHVEERLQGQLLGIAGTKEMRETDEDEVLTLAEYTIWEQRYRIEVERVIDPNRDETILVTSIEGRHREDGTADVPDDSVPQYTPITTVANLAPETP